MFALLSWMIVGATLGAILGGLWKVRGLTLAWGLTAGGVGGVVGGLIGRMTAPGLLFAEGFALLAAIVGAVVAMGISYALFAKQRPQSR